MKKIFFLLGTLLFVNMVSSQTNETYLLLTGNSKNIDDVNIVVNAQNNTIFPIKFSYNENMGNSFNIKLVGGENYGTFCGRNFTIGNTIAGDIRMLYNNPQTGVSINDVCPEQAAAISEVIRCAGRLQQILLQKSVTVTKKKEPCNCPEDEKSKKKEISKGKSFLISETVDRPYNAYGLGAYGNKKPVSQKKLSPCREAFNSMYGDQYDWYFEEYEKTGKIRKSFKGINNRKARKAAKKCADGKTTAGRNLGVIIPGGVVGTGALTYGVVQILKSLKNNSGGGSGGSSPGYNEGDGD